MRQTVIHKKTANIISVIRRSEDVSLDSDITKHTGPVLMGSSLFRSAGAESVEEKRLQACALFGSSCRPVLQRENDAGESPYDKEIQKREQEKDNSDSEYVQKKPEAFTGKNDDKEGEGAFGGSTIVSRKNIHKSEYDTEIQKSTDDSETDKYSLNRSENFKDVEIQKQETDEDIKSSSDKADENETVQKASEKGDNSTASEIQESIQAKYTVGSPDDHLEREADSTADNIVRLPEPVNETEKENKEEKLQKQSIFRKIFRKKSEPEIPVVDEETANGIEMSRGMGEPLSADVMKYMGQRFGADFSKVRVHTDNRAGKLSRKIRAQAFTIGSDIYFGEGKYNPGTTEGKRLIAHELTHTIQQGHATSKEVPPSKATRKIQRWSLEGILSAVTDYIPGYKLITVIIGKDPVTGKDVPRTGENIINGIIGLIPGGKAIFGNLQESGAIARAGQWLDQEISKLNITWTGIKALLSEAWDRISIFNSIGTNIDIVKNLFAPTYNRIAAFASAIGSKLKEFVLEGALSLAGGAGKRIMGIINKGKAVFDLIISNPIGFASNLISAVRLAINQFSKNFLTHFKNSILNWLFGTLSSAGITLPKKFDVYGIFSLVMQILGLTYQNIRAKFVKALGKNGEKIFSAVEKSVEVIKDLVTKGPASLWDHLKQFVGDLTGIIIKMVGDWVAQTIVFQAITKLASMFNPVGALIQAAIAIYNTVMFFIERASQIAQFVSSVFDSIGNIATGKIGAAANYIENAMATGMTLIISFLARFAGLGGISEKIRGVIAAIRKPINAALDKVIGFVVDKAKKVYEKIAGGIQGGIAAAKKFLFPQTTFTAGEEKHTLSVKETAGSEGVLMIASVPQPVLEFLAKYEKDKKSKISGINKELIGNIKSLINGRIKNKLAQIKKAVDKKRPESELSKLRSEYLEIQVELSEMLRQLLGKGDLKDALDKYKFEGMVGTYASMPKPTGDDMTADHQPQAAILVSVSKYDIFDETAIQDRAAKRAANGYAINLHKIRHMAGRTYGGKGDATKNEFLGKADKIVQSKKSKKKKREEIVTMLKTELNEDVKTMLNVIKKKENWIEEEELDLKDKDKKTLIKTVQSQIEAGEGTLKNQDLDSLKN